MTTELAPAETQALVEHEAVIERGLNTFTEVGNALLAIRDERLHRASHRTFEDYCRDRWGFSERRARQFMASAEVVGTIVPTGLPLPANEGQARELARVPEAERADVWRETIERTDGKPTAAAIRETYAPAPQPATATPRDEAVPTATHEPQWGAEEASAADVVRCDAGHIAARETFEDVGGCPYCLHTQGERQAAIQARESLLRRQKQEREAERRRQFDQAVADYPELAHYAQQPDKAIALGANLKQFAEPELSMRREILAKSIAADKRRDQEPDGPDGPNYYELADAIFVALNGAAQVVARSGGVETLRQAVPGAPPLMIQTWRDQFAELSETCAALSDECAPQLRSVK